MLAGEGGRRVEEGREVEEVCSRATTPDSGGTGGYHFTPHHTNTSSPFIIPQTNSLVILPLLHISLFLDSNINPGTSPSLSLMPVRGGRRGKGRRVDQSTGLYPPS